MSIERLAEIMRTIKDLDKEKEALRKEVLDLGVVGSFETPSGLLVISNRVNREVNENALRERVGTRTFNNQFRNTGVSMRKFDANKSDDLDELVETTVSSVISLK